MEGKGERPRRLLARRRLAYRPHAEAGPCISPPPHPSRRIEATRHQARRESQTHVVPDEPVGAVLAVLEGRPGELDERLAARLAGREARGQVGLVRAEFERPAIAVGVRVEVERLAAVGVGVAMVAVGECRKR